MAKITAIIDIGSNSIRMLVFKKTSRFGFYLLNESKNRARISENSYQNNGYLQETAMQRAEDAIAEFVNIANFYKARKIICVATSAVRDAPNKEQFIRRVREKSSINIKVIDGKKESYYGGMAALNLLPPVDGITIDIGGGSTELALIKDKKIIDTISFQLGTVRLKELFFDSDKNKIESARRYIQEQLKELPSDFKSNFLIGIGGTLRAIAQSIMKKEKYPLNTIHAYRYAIDKNQDFFEKVINAKKSEELKNLGFKEDRFDVIIEGVLIFIEVAKAIGANEVITSGVGVREGVFLSDLLRNSAGRFPQGFNPSVKSLMDRFEIDTRTASYSSKIVLELFDILKSLHKMDEKYKRYLLIAVKLSEIGTYINFYKKNFHAFNIIFEGLDYGFSHEERVLISKLVKNQQKKLLTGYEPKSNLKNFIPDLKTLKWLSFILFVSKEINADRSFPKILLKLENKKLIIESTRGLTLAKASLANVKTPDNKLEVEFSS